MFKAGTLFIKFVDLFVKRCPKSGKIVAFRPKKTALYGLLPLTGLAALIWFLVRVLPKPSRAAYPCQQVAAPLASSFIAWVAGLAMTVFAFRRARRFLGQSRFLVGSFCAVAAVAALIFTTLHTTQPGQAAVTSSGATLPVGTAQGIFPGRVVWAWDPAATNSACNNAAGNYWWQDSNTDQAVVETMLSKSLQQLTGTTTDAAAWNAIFRHHNAQKRGLADSGYRAGEKIMIKVNLCSAFGMTHPDQGGSYTKDYYANIGDYRAMPDVSPQMMKALLKSLTTVAGVRQSDITLGDPNRPFFDQFYQLIQPSFPDVNYLDPWGKQGRTLAVPTATDVIFYSSHDASDPATKAVSDKLPQAFLDATYMINVAALKGHELAGITLCAKNHFGSQCRTGSNGQGTAALLHSSLPIFTPGYGKYRVLVDFMGHKDLGGKTALYLVDGLWGGFRSIPNQPNKWVSAPFNNAWPSSLLASQDPVAIESVGYDFLKEEYKAANGYPTGQTNPNAFDGIDDYLLQAASSAYWPKLDANGQPFAYDPENDGTALPSLGVYDRWNNATDKQYSKNLNPTLAGGIELIQILNAPVNAIQLPGRLQVEDYRSGGEDVAYHDTTPGNQGSTHRTDGVDLEATTDAGGGYNVGWTEAGEWLAYDIKVAKSGAYLLTARMASANAGTKTLSVSIDGTTVGTFNLTDASGWQSWKDVAVPNVMLAAGSHALRLTMSTGGFNLNYLDVLAQPNLPPVAKAGPDQTLAPNTLVTLDGRGSSDPDQGPSSLSYAWSQISGPSISLMGSGTAQPTFTPVSAGTYTFRLTVSDGTASHADEVAITVGAANLIPLPGRIQAEDYRAGGEGVGYHDTTAGNTGGAYRSDHVDLEACTDAGGGYDIGWTEAGEWLAYEVNVARSGTYSLTARMASAVAGAKTLSVSLDGTSLGTLTFADASGWQSWKDVTLPGVPLSAGVHTLRLTLDTGGFNLNHLDVTAQDNANLLLNGDFAAGLNNWTPYWATADLGSTLLEGQSARMQISGAGINVYDLQLFQVASLSGAKTYTLAFDLKGETTGQSFKVVIEHNGDPWTGYFQQQLQFTQAAGTWQRFSVSWPQAASDASVKIGFHFGTFGTADVWLDNVVLTGN